MPTAVEFMRQYRNLQVNFPIDDPVRRMTRVGTCTAQIRKYFMMSWKEGTEELKDFNDVTGGGARNAWFRTNGERIKNAAMGKGAPGDYALALEWAVRSGKIKNPNAISVQAYSDSHLGIDCSGFVSNFLIASGKRVYDKKLVLGTPAAAYFNMGMPVNDPTQVKPGDLLVFMTGNIAKTDPGHVAVVESYVAQSRPGGNMRVVEATGAAGANPKLVDSMYDVEQVVPMGGAVPCMILVVKRFGQSGFRVAVRRV